ncbi:peptidase inhibitor family I36 protein [Arcanobacterium pluranimalium]|uniref:peptidase inhibitor family I36 protein n=1 Tax=Arcanobacterium pluranimalium TaxID=108028 RepID=UPI003084378F
MVAPIASAGTGNCKAGASCLWTQNDYNGGFAYNEDHSSPVYSGINNRANSVVANGASCPVTAFYDYRDGNSGSYFMLYSRTRIGSNYQDPNLSNGAGVGPEEYPEWASENWSNRISRVTYMHCY